MVQCPAPTGRDTPCRPADFATLVEALDHAAGAATGMNFHGSRGALEQVLPYARLAEDARAIGARLIGAGLDPGDRVGLVAETEADFVRAFMGAVVAGLVPCPMPLPTAFGERVSYGTQIRRIATVAGVRAVIAGAAYGDLVAGGIEGLDLAYLGPLSGLPEVEAALPGAPDPEAIAYLQFSSGTTRAPRGIAVSHRALMANLHGMAAHALRIGPGDRGMSWLPFYHDMGLVGCMLLPLATQMSIDYLATRDFIRRPGLWPEMIARAGATLSYAPSFGYRLAAQRARHGAPLDLSGWRIAGIGGDMVNPANLDSFAEAYAEHGFRPTSFLPSYGMAELALGLSFAPLGTGCRAERLDLAALEAGRVVQAAAQARAARAFAHCGHPLPGHEVEIRDDAGAALEPRRVGRVFVRGPSVMQGYFADPAATAEVLSPDGWLETGDKGYFSDGELVITGRAKDLIIINGRNIWPQDIEWTLEHRIEGLRDGGVAAFGMVAETDAGEEGLAVVLELRGADPDLRARLRGEADALIRQIYGVAPAVAFCRPGALPRTTSGKLSRARARDLYRAGSFEG